MVQITQGAEQIIWGKMTLPNKKVVNTVTYDVEDCMHSCVERYLSLAGPKTKLKKARTPFIAEDQRDNPSMGADRNGAHGRMPSLQPYVFNYGPSVPERPRLRTTSKEEEGHSSG